MSALYPVIKDSVVALDCATSCGWAWGTSGLIRNAGVKAFPLPRGASPGMRWVMFRVWLTDQLELWKPEIVTYEQPFIAGMRSGTVAEIAYGMCTRVQELCTERGIEYRPVANSLIKQHATGAGNAKKEWVIAAAGKRWPDYDPKRDPGGDEADARFLLSFAQSGFPDLAAAKAQARAAEKAAAKAARDTEKAVAIDRVRESVVAVLAAGYSTPMELKREVEFLLPWTKSPWPEAQRQLKAMLANGRVIRDSRGWRLA